MLPDSHLLARKRTLQVVDLKEEPFILFARRIGPLAYDRTIACCERVGFLPQIVQEASQWPTVIRLVAAGIGVSLLPACISEVAVAGVVYRNIHAACRTTVDLGVRDGADQTIAKNFMEVAREFLVQ